MMMAPLSRSVVIISGIGLVSDGSGTFRRGAATMTLTAPQQIRTFLLLAANCGQAVSRMRLTDACLGADNLDVDPKTLNVVICHLRKKRAALGFLLIARRSVGYGLFDAAEQHRGAA